MKHIKVGDYIKGTEQFGREAIQEYGIESTLTTREMRGWVENIYTDRETKTNVYNIKADDTWGGARGGTICEALGPVTKLEESEIEPFWWKLKDKVEDNSAICKCLRRDWKAFDLVKHFKGTEYRIVGIGTDTETEEDLIIYKKADNTGRLWIRPRKEFESEVDKDKYPDAKQRWRFELINE